MKTSDKVTLPKEIEENAFAIEYVGSYAFALTSEGLYLVGFHSTANVTEEAISKASIMPISLNSPFEKDDFFEHDLDEDKVYYYVTWKDRYFLFDNMETALKFITILTSHKASGIEHSFSAE